LAVEKLKISQS